MYSDISKFKHRIFTCLKMDYQRNRKKPISKRDVTDVYGHHTHTNKRRTCKSSRLKSACSRRPGSPKLHP